MSNVRGARALAEKLRRSLTERIAAVLGDELRQHQEKGSLPERLTKLARKAKALAGPEARDMTKDEIDAMWGQ